MTDQIDLDRLAELASNATPGPWEHDEIYVWCSKVNSIFEEHSVADSTPRDAPFIAALDPDTVRALIERVKTAEAEAEKKLEQVRALHHPVNIEPSGTICAECSNQMPNGRYLPTTEWPCPTVATLDQTKEGE